MVWGALGFYRAYRFIDIISWAFFRGPVVIVVDFFPILEYVIVYVVFFVVLFGELIPCLCLLRLGFFDSYSITFLFLGHFVFRGFGVFGRSMLPFLGFFLYFP